MLISRRDCLATLGTVVGMSALPPSEASPAEETASSQPGDQLFSAPFVRLQLHMTAKEFAELAPARRNPPGFGGAEPRPPGFGGGGPRPPGFGDARPRLPKPETTDTHRNTFGVEFPWSRGKLTVDGKSYSDVGVRYKGNYTYMAAARSLKKSLKLDLNRHVKGQKLDGLTMLNLHSGVSDPTRIRESLSYGYFREARVPAPRTMFAELSLTVPEKYEAEPVGLYTLVEQVNKAFLKRHFGDGRGMLLKPEGLQGGLMYLGDRWDPYETRYHPEEKPTSDQQARLIEFTRLIHEAPDEQFANRLHEFLDIEAFLVFLAANVLLANLDSYLGYGHNFYLYLVPQTNRFAFIPWDLDLSLATWPAAGTPEQLVDLSIDHPHAGTNRLLDRLFAIPACKKSYRELIQDQMTHCFTSDKLLAHIEALEATVREPLQTEQKAAQARQETTGGFGFGNGQFGQTMPPRRFIRKRIESVQRQLAGETTGFVPRAIAGR